MRLFAIGDLHLPGGDEKPMNVFGDHWEDHFQRIGQDWLESVSEADTVLIPGDISWAMQLRDAEADLRAIGRLPGRKVLVKGNHDYWWNGLTQVRRVLPEGMMVLQHSAIDLGEAVVCGTRGWTLPTKDAPLPPEEQKIYQRELLRLEMALTEGKRMAQGRPLVAMTHFPPLYQAERDTEVTRLLTAYGVHTAVYGHLHGAGIRAGFNGEHEGVRYRLVSCDSLGFRLAEIQVEA